MASYYKFKKNLKFKSLLEAAFDLVSGHDHDGVTSKAISFGEQGLVNGKLWVGNASGVAAAVTPSGDVTISNAGVSAIGAGKVTLAQMAASAKTQILTTFVPGLSADGDLAAGPLMVVPTGMTATLSSVTLLPMAASSGIDDSNTSVFTLTDGTNTIVTKTYNASVAFPAAGAAGSLGTLDGTHKVLAAGEVLTLSITNGTSAATPALSVQVVYTLADAA